MVGAVIVKDGRIIGEGYHKKYGELHAERNAIASLTESAEGAVIYVTLEPCCHHGKTPPCTEAIIEQKIRKVVIGSRDPNPKVAGKGVQMLREAGVTVVEDFMREECDQLNPVFFHYITTKTPYVVMKYAMTMDGKISTKTGASKWVTGETARRHVAQQRHRYAAIMAGIGTILTDDPQLTCRIEGGKNPIRIICDTTLRIPLSANVVSTAKQIPTIIATCCRDAERCALYEKKGCHVLLVEERNGHVDLEQLMYLLGEKQIDSILLEGGGTLNWAALSSGIVQKVQAYIAPKLFGGQAAKTPIEGEGICYPTAAFRLKNSCVLPLGEDFLIESEVEQSVYGNH